MTREVEVDDVFVSGLPLGLAPDDPHMRERLTIVATRMVWRQWDNAVGPRAVTLAPIDFLVTQDPADIERFQPAHDCAACLAGNDQAMTYLREHPDRWVVLANLHYTEVWDE